MGASGRVGQQSERSAGVLCYLHPQNAPGAVIQILAERQWHIHFVRGVISYVHLQVFPADKFNADRGHGFVRRAGCDGIGPIT